MGFHLGRFFKKNLGNIGDMISVANPVAGMVLKAAGVSGKSGKATHAVLDGITGLIGKKDWDINDFIEKFNGDSGFKAELAKLEAENEKEWQKLHIEDMQNAREAEKHRISHGSWLTANMNSVMAILIIGLFSFSHIYSIMYPQPIVDPNTAKNMDLLKILLIAVINYYFGSSKGSKDKSDSIHKKLNDH